MIIKYWIFTMRATCHFMIHKFHSMAYTASLFLDEVEYKNTRLMMLMRVSLSMDESVG